MNGAARLLAGPLLLALLLATRAVLEASMLRHMLLQLPLLVLCGAAWRPWLARAPALAARLAALDQHGLTGFAAASFATAGWMIPRALEAALDLPAVELLKFGSLLLVGACLPGSLGRAHLVLQLFFVANLCAMTAIAGMLYQDLPQRLCNAYLLDDQNLTGRALVGLALALGLAWCAGQRGRLLDTAG